MPSLNQPIAATARNLIGPEHSIHIDALGLALQEEGIQDLNSLWKTKAMGSRHGGGKFA
jgi:hypothetical protein